MLHILKIILDILYKQLQKGLRNYFFLLHVGVRKPDFHKFKIIGKLHVHHSAAKLAKRIIALLTYLAIYSSQVVVMFHVVCLTTGSVIVDVVTVNYKCKSSDLPRISTQRIFMTVASVIIHEITLASFNPTRKPFDKDTGEQTRRFSFL